MAGIGLQQFLENHKADNLWTHTSQKGGKYFIPDEHKDQFYELYVESINDQEKQYLVEKTSDIGPLRIDFDFIYIFRLLKDFYIYDFSFFNLDY